jgi:hypothetical protein
MFCDCQILNLTTLFFKNLTILRDVGAIILSPPLQLLLLLTVDQQLHQLAYILSPTTFFSSLKRLHHVYQFTAPLGSYIGSLEALWSPSGQSTYSSSPFYVVAGHTYTLKVIDSNNCPASSSATVTVPIATRTSHILFSLFSPTLFIYFVSCTVPSKMPAPLVAYQGSPSPNNLLILGASWGAVSLANSPISQNFLIAYIHNLDNTINASTKDGKVIISNNMLKKKTRRQCVKGNVIAFIGLDNNQICNANGDSSTSW